MDVGGKTWTITTFLLATVLGMVAWPLIHPIHAPSVNRHDLCGPHSLIEAPYTSMYRPTPEPRMRDYPDERLTDVRWFINRHGLRDDPLSLEKPRDTARILVVGDSFTEGYGVNTTQRYTEKVEKRLDDRFSTDIQVINAGFAGAGMKEYYSYLYNEGWKLNPDIVVVGFTPGDDVSRERYARWKKVFLNNHNISSMDERHEFPEVNDEWLDKKKSFLASLSWNNSKIIRFGNLMHRLAQKKRFSIVFYQIPTAWGRPQDHYLFSPVAVNGTRYATPLHAWESICGVDVIHPWKELRKIGKDASYMLPDSHFNGRGHTLLAKELAPHLVDLLHREGIQ